MATGIAKPSRRTSSGDGAGERVIHSQLRRAGWHVKWVEAGRHLLTLLIGKLIFFLAAALIDHWILPLGWFGRWLLCLVFVGGSGWFLITRIGPLLVRAVNPTYSARAIEEAQPSLKNSLVNFLLLKQDNASVKEAVLEAMEHRAASDIATVEVESAIDRTPLIRMGYVLCGVLAVAERSLSNRGPGRRPLERHCPAVARADSQRAAGAHLGLPGLAGGSDRRHPRDARQR
jgi:hypothetical protein